MNATKPSLWARLRSGLSSPSLQAEGLRRPDDWTTGFKQGFLLGAAVLVVVLPHPRSGTAPEALQARPATATALASLPRQFDLNGEAASPEVRQLAQWVLEQRDNGTRPFVILDKQDARVFVFEASGRLHGASPVLLGYARGDHTVAGIGQRPIDQVRPEERTTPAGRFVARPGRNTLKEDVLWVDYEAAVSMHRVRLTDPRERRLERLASPMASERRISYGCINLPVAFFEQVLWPRVGRQGGIVYVLPEVKPLTEVFPALARQPAPAPRSRLLTRAAPEGAPTPT